MHLIVGFMLSAAIGVLLLGSPFAHQVSPARLRTGFAMFVLAVAVLLIAKNYTVLLSPTAQ